VKESLPFLKVPSRVKVNREVLESHHGSILAMSEQSKTKVKQQVPTKAGSDQGREASSMISSWMTSQYSLSFN